MKRHRTPEGRRQGPELIEAELLADEGAEQPPKRFRLGRAHDGAEGAAGDAGRRRQRHGEGTMASGSAHVNAPFLVRMAGCL